MATSPSVEQFSFHGWDAFGLSNGIVSAVCVPEIGGRLMQFSLGGRDYLFMNADLLGKRFSYDEHAGDGTILNWKNYGGDKTWPAPQGWDGEGQWHGPPDPVLDSGRYTAATSQNDASASVSMTSPPDERSGLQITRKLSLSPASSRLRLDLTFENISRREIRWSIWDVAQLACVADDGALNDDSWLYIPTDPTSEPAYDILFGEDNAQYQLDAANNMLAVRYQGLVGKIGVHSPAGWLAFVDGRAGSALCMQFDYQPGAAYPDNGATVECWTESPGAPSPIPIRSPGYILEAETLSPLYTLAPGETASTRVVWSAASCPTPVVSVNNLGCVNEGLSLDIDAGMARVQGVFGCFIAGRAVLDLVTADGTTIKRVDLGAVSPLASLRLDATLPLNERASALRLDIMDEAGEYAGTLDQTAIHRP